MKQIDIPSKQIIRDQNLLRGWVIYQLTLQRRSLAAVARDASVTRQCLYTAFRQPYPLMEKRIADALGLQPKDLWPDRYDQHGLPNRPMGRPKKSISKKAKDTTPNRRCNVHEGKAA